MNKDIVWDFCNFLWEYRVFVPIDGGVIKDNIQEYVIDAKEEHEWTPQEIKHQQEIEYQLASSKKSNSQGNPNGQLQATPQTTSGYQTPQVPQAAVSQPVPQAPSHQQV